jgi:glycosyltransferase involved in cell wall biosynthesis
MNEIPKTAFCFHDPLPSGASVWLREYLLDHETDTSHSWAILPGPSPLEKPLRNKGICCHQVKIELGSINTITLAHRLKMLANRFSLVFQYIRLFKRLKPQVVYVNSSFQIAPMIAARILSLPLIVHVHEGWHMGRTHNLKTWIVRHTAQTAIFAAKAGKKLFEPKGKKSHWEVSPNGVDPQLQTLRKNRSLNREHLNLEPTEKVFLFLGTLCERKGVQDLAKVWPQFYRKHPHARLWLAGTLADEERNPLIRKMASDPPKGCRYLGYRKDIPELMAAADFFVLPTYGEAMPISISEAMMTGTPVIARNVADVGWQIGEGRGFLFEGNGPKRLLATMLQAYESPAEARHRAQKAQAFAQKHLTKEEQYNQITRLIKQAIAP